MHVANIGILLFFSTLCISRFWISAYSCLSLISKVSPTSSQSICDSSSEIAASRLSNSFGAFLGGRLGVPKRYLTGVAAFFFRICLICLFRFSSSSSARIRASSISRFLIASNSSLSCWFFPMFVMNRFAAPRGLNPTFFITFTPTSKPLPATPATPFTIFIGIGPPPRRAASRQNARSLPPFFLHSKCASCLKKAIMRAFGISLSSSSSLRIFPKGFFIGQLTFCFEDGGGGADFWRISSM